MPRRRLRVAIRKFEPFERAIARQFEDFVARTGIDAALEVESLDLDPLYATMFTEGGLRRGDWDIGFVVTDWLPMCHRDGHLLDLAPLQRAAPLAGYPEDWSPSLTAAQAIDGRLYGFPYHDGPQCLVYRSDLFADPDHRAAFRARTGRELAPPRSWDEYREVVATFSRPEDGFYGTVLAAFPDGHNAVYDFCIHLWSRGGDLLDTAGRPALDRPAAAAALDFYRGLAREDGRLVHPGAAAIDSVRSGQIFAEGRVALMTNWFGFAAYAADAPSSRVRGRVDVAPIPAGPGGRPVSLTVHWVLGIGAGCRDPELAFAFVKHAAGPEMDRLLTLEGGIGCRRSTWTDGEVNRRIPFYARLDELHAAARPLPSDPRFPDLAHILDDMVAAAIATDVPTAALLADAQARAVALFGA